MSKSVPVPTDVREKVEAKLRKCIELAEKRYGRKFEFPTVRYKLRGTTGGIADVRDWVINLNSVLLMENGDKFINRTVPHELAHLVDYRLHPENFRPRGYSVTRTGVRRAKRSVHGSTWKAIMRVFGAPPNRCHTYDTTNSKVHSKRTKRHVWVCGCGEAEMKLGPKRHKKQLLLQERGYYVRRHPVSKCGVYTYRGVEGAAPEPLLRAADASGKANPKRPAPRHKISKLAACRDAYRATDTRADNIKRFVALGCTPAGAATYYAKIKKELG